ncbi:MULTISPECIES: pyridoxal phosphate-dependent aminotransferase [unclassified Granulicatella]|uniref:pyridoxal phosphate-dependent aminotransferase n=1 Tax=unclassified Granulicatella TaxID=2630493 RepID=UPI001072FD2D|nr:MULTISPECIES: aminotransferase class I/II-fold pyridoxal phosphate-dependent enzyme [unclassified Granulicatella]MBF0780380.1 aminotransferase class I/II-fold pyridoxal phosphate-dependent enzyme [Granulicatella sp. 19428wC4_WM01]TFU95468.1 aminotransferase class I/II-fold pyridoxal phosphate-dependent enzyme [Granulicatella sp. WM01]
MTNTALQHIVASEILAYNELFAKTEGIHLLTIGAPDFDVPDFVKEAGKKAIDDGFNGYAPSKGMPVLINAFVDWLDRRYTLKYDASQIIVTTGESQGLAAVMQALINPGDAVIVPTPAFPQYELCTLINRGEFIPVDTSNSQFLLTPEQLRATKQAYPHAKVVVLTYPSNPTGVTYSTEELQAFAKVAEELGIIVISDEIYSELVYDQAHDSIARYLPQQTILLNGASKTYAMTGWRIGFIAAPKHLFEAIFKAHQSSTPVGSQFAQIGAATAFNNGDDAILTMRQAYKERRDYLVYELTDMGFEVVSPDGAFYLFPRLPKHVHLDDKQFATQLAIQGKVGVIPGSVFGKGGENHIRISYATSMPVLQESMARLRHFLTQLA